MPTYTVTLKLVHSAQRALEDAQLHLYAPSGESVTLVREDSNVATFALALNEGEYTAEEWASEWAESIAAELVSVTHA